MPATGPLKFDTIGYWSEMKLDIIKDYAVEYSKIMSAPSQRARSFWHIYIDAFAGGGMHISRQTGEYIKGSPLNAFNVKPPFREYHLIDLDPGKVDSLRALLGDRPEVHIYQGNCNRILLKEVFPNVQYRDFRRGLCLLDPYGLHLDWEVLRTAGQMRSIEVFLNFPVADMNRNVFWRWRDMAEVDPADVERMNAFWGDESWREVVYPPGTEDLFGRAEKQPNEIVAEGFRQRLKKVAGFAHVPEPIPMRNTSGAIVYYLFFASPNPVANKIVDHIFRKYENREKS